MGDMIKSLTDFASDFLPSSTAQLTNGSSDDDSNTSEAATAPSKPQPSTSTHPSIEEPASPPASPAYFSPLDGNGRRGSGTNGSTQSSMASSSAEDLAMQFEEKQSELPAWATNYIHSLRQQLGEAEQTMASMRTTQENLLKRNNDLALLLSHNQKTVQEQEVSLRELRSSLSYSRHELMDERRRSSSVSASLLDDNPYLSSNWRRTEESYLAPSAATIMSSDDLSDEFPAMATPPASSDIDAVLEMPPSKPPPPPTHEEEEAAQTHTFGERAKLLQEDERTAKLRGMLDDIFTSADVDEDGVLNSTEIIRLCSIVNIEAEPDEFAKRFEGAVVDRLVWLVGILTPSLPPPSTRSISQSLWGAVQGNTIEEVLMDDGKRGLLETEMHRWLDILQRQTAPGESDEDSDAKWTLGTEFAQPDSEMSTKYAVDQTAEDLGEGRAGHVKPCTLKETGETLACKIILKNIQSAEETQRELTILRELRGEKGVAQLMDVYEGERELYLMTELCEGGELYDIVLQKSDEDTAFTEVETVTLMRQILSVIDHLHEGHRIVHRDMKPENVLLRRRNDLSDVCVIDFGFSRFFEPGQRLTTRVGTVYYTASEVWQERYDNKCDLFSVGVLMYVLLCSYPPFDGEDDNEILRKVMRGKFTFPEDDWDQVSEEAKDLIRRLMSKYPRRRPTAREALEHEWFKKFPDTGTPAITAAASVKTPTSASEKGSPAVEEIVEGDEEEDEDESTAKEGSVDGVNEA